MPTPQLAEPRLAVLGARLDTAERELRKPPTEGVASDVSVLLGHVAADLVDMAALANTATAASLSATRADVSGHLLAAATLESAGAPASTTVAMLRRATRAARSGLEATYGPLTITAGA